MSYPRVNHRVKKIEAERTMTVQGRTFLAGGSWISAWNDFWRTLVPPPCRYCARPQRGWRQMRRRSRGTLMQGARYCGPECLEQALLRVLRRSQRAASPAGLAFHRIPLGLLLLSRQQLTGEQLRTALKLQRESSPASSGKNTGVTNRKIGFWLQDLGFVTEHQVTAALARQWSCPMRCV